MIPRQLTGILLSAAILATPILMTSCETAPSDTAALTLPVTTPSTDAPDTPDDDVEMISLPEYDFLSMDLPLYIKLPDGYTERDYTEGLELMDKPGDDVVMAEIRSKYLKSLAVKMTLDADATVQNYDTVIMDFKGTLNDVAFSGGTANDTEHEIVLESSTFIDGFDAGLIGMKAGETKDLELKFPDPYPNNESLAGKDVVFKVTIDSIIRYEYPELTDDLIKQNPDIFGKDVESAEKLKTDIYNTIAASYDNYNKTQIAKAAWLYITENATVLSYPEEIVSAYSDVLLRSCEQMAKQNGSSLQEYIVEQGYLTQSAFVDGVITVQAKEMIKEKLVLYSCAKEYDVTVTTEQAREQAQKEFKEYIEPNLSMYSMMYGITDLDSYINFMGGIGAYKDSMVYSAVMDKICERFVTDEQ